MKSHKYWSIGALVSMIGTCYTGYKNMKSAHKYCAFSSLICMACAALIGKAAKKKLGKKVLAVIGAAAFVGAILAVILIARTPMPL